MKESNFKTENFWQSHFLGFEYFSLKNTPDIFLILWHFFKCFLHRKILFSFFISFYDIYFPDSSKQINNFLFWSLIPSSSNSLLINDVSKRPRRQQNVCTLILSSVQWYKGWMQKWCLFFVSLNISSMYIWSLYASNISFVFQSLWSVINVFCKSFS